MSQNDPEVLRAEIARTRAELSDNVDALADTANPKNIANRQVKISGSVGIVVHPDHGGRDKLVAHADAAMYAAKRTGGGTYAMFEAHMNTGALEELTLQNDLRQAVEFGQLQLHYQPKVTARDGAISGVEALLRRPPSMRVRLILHQIGFALLVLLLLSVTVMDVGRLFG